MGWEASRGVADKHCQLWKGLIEKCLSVELCVAIALCCRNTLKTFSGRKGIMSRVWVVAAPEAFCRVFQLGYVRSFTDGGQKIRTLCVPLGKL